MSNLKGSSPNELTNDDLPPASKNENKKRKFRPLQGLRRIFGRQKLKEQISGDDQGAVKKRMKKNNNKTQSVVLSVSHESIFRNDSNCLPITKSDLVQTQATISTSIDSIHKIITQDNFKEEIEQKSNSSGNEASITSRTSSNLEFDFDLSLLEILNEASELLDEKICDDEDTNSKFALDHNAAKHKIAIRPKKTHALPTRFKKVQNEYTELNQTILKTIIPPEETGNQSKQNNTGKTLENQNVMMQIAFKTITDKSTINTANISCSMSQQKIKIKSSSLPTKIQFKSENLSTKKLPRSLSLSMSPVINRNSLNEFNTNFPQSTKTLSFNDRFALIRLNNNNHDLTTKIHSKKLNNQSSSVELTNHKFKEKIPEFLNVQLKKVNDLNKKSSATLQKNINNVLENKVNIVEKKHRSLIIDDEPELLKVFARRSLLLKNIDSDNDDLKESNSDKENENDNEKAAVSKIKSFMKIPQFKNIQQRKEEWEKRAQQAKNTIYKK